MSRRTGVLAARRRTSAGSTVTSAVFPTAATHPNAVWTRSGNRLTSTSRRYLPVYDNTDGFVLGTTKPTFTNTGCRIAQASLTPYVGTSGNLHELVTSADGQVISGLYLDHARIRVRHKNVTIRDCIVTIGFDAARLRVQANAAIVVENPSFDSSGLSIEYVTVDPAGASSDGTQTSDYDTYGFYMNGGVVYRCALRNVVDGIAQDLYPVSGGGAEAVHIWGCYVSTNWYSVDPGQSDGTHNDAIQIAGGAGHTIIGNTLINPTGGVVDGGSGFTVRGQNIVLTPYHPMVPAAAASISTRDAGSCSDVTIRSNWLSGAFTQVANWLPLQEGAPGSANLVVVGNRHGGQCVWPILFTQHANDMKTAISGNVADTGGVIWNSGTIAAGGAVNVTAATNTQSTATSSFGASKAYAGNDRVIEPGSTCWIAGKGTNASSAWIKTGAWSVVSNTGAAITLSSGTSADGYTTTSFVAPSPAATTTQTIVLRFTPTGIATTDDITVTIPPDQVP